MKFDLHTSGHIIQETGVDIYSILHKKQGLIFTPCYTRNRSKYYISNQYIYKNRGRYLLNVQPESGVNINSILLNKKG